MSDVVDLLKDSPVAEQLRSEQRQRVETERRDLAEQLAEALEQRESAGTEAGKRIQTAARKLEKARQALREAEAAYQAARAQLAATSGAAERRASELRRKLEALPCPALDDFLREMRDELTDLQVRRPQEQFKAELHDLDTVEVLAASDHPSVKRRAAAVREAMDRAEQLRFEALTDDDIKNRLNMLRDSLPDIEVEEIQQ